jgi:hypothetical protein
MYLVTLSHVSSFKRLGRNFSNLVFTSNPCIEGTLSIFSTLKPTLTTPCNVAISSTWSDVVKVYASDNVKCNSNGDDDEINVDVGDSSFVTIEIPQKLSIACNLPIIGSSLSVKGKVEGDVFLEVNGNIKLDKVRGPFLSISTSDVGSLHVSDLLECDRSRLSIGNSFYVQKILGNAIELVQKKGDIQVKSVYSKHIFINKTSNGSCSIDSLHGDLKFRNDTSGGSIKIGDITGSVDICTSEGLVDVHFNSIRSNSSIESKDDVSVSCSSPDELVVSVKAGPSEVAEVTPNDGTLLQVKEQNKSEILGILRTSNEPKISKSTSGKISSDVPSTGFYDQGRSKSSNESLRLSIHSHQGKASLSVKSWADMIKKSVQAKVIGKSFFA